MNYDLTLKNGDYTINNKKLNFLPNRIFNLGIVTEYNLSEDISVFFDFLKELRPLLKNAFRQSLAIHRIKDFSHNERIIFKKGELECSIYITIDKNLSMLIRNKLQDGNTVIQKMSNEDIFNCIADAILVKLMDKRNQELGHRKNIFKELQYPKFCDLLNIFCHHPKLFNMLHRDLQYIKNANFENIWNNEQAKKKILRGIAKNLVESLDVKYEANAYYEKGVIESYSVPFIDMQKLEKFITRANEKLAEKLDSKNRVPKIN